MQKSTASKPVDSLRIRHIRHDFVCGEEMAGLSFVAQLLCERLPMKCDKNGTFLWKPNTIKHDLFGKDSKVTQDIFDAALQEVQTRGWIKRWTIGSDHYATFTPFQEYQGIHGSELTNDSRWPSPKIGQDFLGLPRTDEEVSNGNSKGKGEGNSKGEGVCNGVQFQTTGNNRLSITTDMVADVVNRTDAGRTVEDIAVELNIPVGAVKRCLEIAREREVAV